ncbi:MAG: DUF4294 domain-containing protein [Chitinophagales bacterium]|jgi:hypothetical protein|nr:DUF4294 domain-containing protein [Chitinophagales bacterium]
MKYFLVLFLGIVVQQAWSQDTIYQIEKTLETIEVNANKNKRTPEEEEKYQRLRRRVLKVYPYALMAKEIMMQAQDSLAKLNRNNEKKRYLKQRENELRERFEYELKRMYTEEGQILTKLVYRETGHTCFELIKKAKSGFKAFMYNMVANRYDVDLKATYDPAIDVDIENMVQLLQSENQLPIYVPQ